MTDAEDRAVVALLFCATFGVGSMSFGSVFAAAGPLLASLAVYFLSACNLHASVAVSRALAAAPVSVRTFSDLGYFAFGAAGRRIVLLTEAGVCLLTPIAFLVLGGTTLLPFTFADTAVRSSATEWIVLMAIGVLPVVLIPTLKGTAPLCVLGCVAALAADLTCVLYSLRHVRFSPRETQVQPAHAVQTFGTIMFAMGTAVLIPSIQRQHSQPSRVANLVSLTLLVITSIYLLIGIVTYYQFGCTAPATLLDQLPPSPWRQFAAGLMLVHVVIAFPVLLNPTLFDLERYVLGKDSDIEVLQQTLARSQSKTAADGRPILGPAPTLASLDTDAFVYGSSAGASPYYQHRSPTSTSVTEASSLSESSTPAATTPATLMETLVFQDDGVFTTRDRICSSLLRTATVALQTLLAVMLQSSFMDILSLIGSTAVTVSCMIMPCLCYLKLRPLATSSFMGWCDKGLCYVIIVSSSVLGAYCTFVAARNIRTNISKYHLFQPANATVALITGDADDSYPFCIVGERN